MENAIEIYMSDGDNEVMVDDTGLKRILQKEGAITYMTWAEVAAPVLKIENIETNTTPEAKQ